MTHRDKNENQLITQAVNAHGIFFKKAVREKLEAMRGLFILGEEYPVPYLEGASIDLLIEFRTNYRRYVLPIECKRGYTATKRWVFFTEPEGRSAKMMYVFEGNESGIDTTDRFRLKEVPICLEGIEIDLSKLRGDSYKAANPDPIWKAGIQMCRASLGFLTQEIEQRKGRDISPQDYENNFRLFPLLLTNAPLSVCELEQGSVEILTGNHKGEIATRNVPYLVLLYPFTPSHDSPDPRRRAEGELKDRYVEPIERGYHFKEGIMVVNSDHIDQFFDLLRATA